MVVTQQIHVNYISDAKYTEGNSIGRRQKNVLVEWGEPTTYI